MEKKTQVIQKQRSAFLYQTVCMEGRQFILSSTRPYIYMLTSLLTYFFDQCSSFVLTNSLDIGSHLIIHPFGKEQSQGSWVHKAVRPFASRKATLSSEKEVANVKLGAIILLGAVPIPSVVGSAYLEKYTVYNVGPFNNTVLL